MRALVVDDARAMRRVLCVRLKQCGFSVEEAESGHSALARLNTEAFELICVDYTMPEMMGNDLIKSIRALPHGDRFKIMMITTEGDSTKIQEFRDVGADDYLFKPFGPEDLRDKLKVLGFAPDGQ